LQALSPLQRIPRVRQMERGVGESAGDSLFSLDSFFVTVYLFAASKLPAYMVKIAGKRPLWRNQLHS